LKAFQNLEDPTLMVIRDDNSLALERVIDGFLIISPQMVPLMGPILSHGLMGQASIWDIWLTS
jgi:hypothetical protein